MYPSREGFNWTMCRTVIERLESRYVHKYVAYVYTYMHVHHIVCAFVHAHVCVSSFV